MYTPAPRISPDVMGTVLHVIPSSQHSPELSRMIQRQRERGIDAKLVLVNHNPQAQRGDFIVTPEQEVKVLAGAAQIPVIEVAGNLGDQQTADYDAYKHFGTFFWNVMFPTLERVNPVVHFHNFRMLGPASMTPRMKYGDADLPGSVFTEIWPNWAEKQPAFRAAAMQDKDIPVRQLITALETAHQRGSGPCIENRPLSAPNVTISLSLPTGDQNFDRLTQTYLEARYRTGYQFSRNLIDHLAGQGAQVIDNLIIVTPEAPSEKERIIAELRNDPTLGRVIGPNIQVFHLSQYLDPEQPDVIAPPADRSLENASNYFGVLVKILKNMAGQSAEKRLQALRALLKDRSTVILVGGGNSTRLPIARDKSEASLGDSNFRRITLGCLLPLIAQHREGGKNRVIMTGCDQLFGTEGAQKGADGKLLSSQDAPLDMVMRTHHEPDEATLKMLTARGVGWHGTDGRLIEGKEKIPRVEQLREKMREHDTTMIDENTMVSSMDPEILFRYLAALMRPSRQAPDRMLIDTLPFDMCRDLFFNLLNLKDTLSTAETKAILTQKLTIEVAVKTPDGTTKKEKQTIDPADLDTLIDDLATISDKTDGIMVIPVDSFYDTGNFTEQCAAEGLILEASVPVSSGNQAASSQAVKKQLRLRDFGHYLRAVSNLGPRGGKQNILAEMPTSQVSSPDYALPGVVNLTDQQSTIIGPDVKLMPGTVVQGYTEIVGNTEIETAEPTVFPPKLIMRNVRIRGKGRLEFTEPHDPEKATFEWRLLQNLDITLSPGMALKVPMGGALIGYTLPGKSKPEMGTVPMGVDLKKPVVVGDKFAMDPVFGSYVMKGLPDDQLLHPIIPGPGFSWMGLIRMWDGQQEVVVTEPGLVSLASIADPKKLIPLLVQAGMLKQPGLETSKPKGKPLPPSADELAAPAGIPGLPAARPAAPGAIPGLPATRPAAPGAIPGLATAAAPVKVGPPAKKYVVPQRFRDQKANLKAVLASSEKNPEGIQLDDRQAEQVIGILAEAHAQHAQGAKK